MLKTASVFSFVRDPVAKFESGVRQAKAHNRKLVKYNADQLLDMVLKQALKLALKPILKLVFRTGFKLD